MKGIRLTGHAMAVIEFAQLVQMAQSVVHKQTAVELQIPQFIIRSTEKYQVYSENFNKKLQVTSNKRALGINGITKPFGYVY